MSTFLSLTCLLFLVLLAGTIAQPGATTTLPPEPEFYPNIQTIGLGYDHVLGNPHSRGVGGDPGFKSKSVFKFTYNKKKLSGDLKYKIPDGVSVRRVNTCSLNSLSREIQGETSYLQDLSDTASFELSVGVGYFGGAFTNSDSYKRVSKNFVSNHDIVFRSKAECSVYFATVEDFVSPSVHDDFIAGVTTLVDAHGHFNEQHAHSFLESYGTFYLSSAMMGSRKVVENVFSDNKYKELKQEGFEFGTAAEVSFELDISAKESVSDKTANEIKNARMFSDSRKEYHESFIGTPPPADGSWLQVQEWPSPIKYHFKSIASLITKINFPSINATMISTNLQRLIDNWCTRGNCNPAEDFTRDLDTFQVNFESTKNNLYAYTKCPEYTVALSVGFRRPEESASGLFKFFPSYYVDEKGYAHCDSPNAANCQLICTHKVNHLEVAYTSTSGRWDYYKFSGEARAKCPLKTKVVGCGVRQSSDKLNEAHPTVYPDDTGYSCIAQLDEGLEVYATCISTSKLINYQIVNAIGVNTFSAKCPKGVSVLGCGYYNQKDSSYYSMYMETIFEEGIAYHACSAYNSRGATVYAICGNIVSE